MLPKRQREVLAFIAKYLDRQGYPPTLREIGAELAIKSTNAVNDHLEALVRKGFLLRDASRSRGVMLLPLAEQELASERPRSVEVSYTPDLDSIPVPLVGRIAAGLPILAVENIERTLRIDPEFLPRGIRPERLFALRVVGDSMVNASIHDGDLIIARSQNVADAGAIVVALVDDSATVKRFFPEPDGIRLQPENPRHSPLVYHADQAQDVSIQGLVVAVIHKVE